VLARPSGPDSFTFVVSHTCAILVIRHRAQQRVALAAG